MTGNEYPRDARLEPPPLAVPPARRTTSSRSRSTSCSPSGSSRTGSSRRATCSSPTPSAGTTSPRCTTAACSRGSARAASPRARRAGSGCRGRASLVERGRRSVGGTIEAAFTALETGVAMNLGGGTHHAGRDFARGYCLFNDVAVALALLRREDEARAALIVDCDVHQGDGTAHIFADDPRTFTLSLHGARNYPFQRMPSDLDVDIAIGHRRRALPPGARRGARLRAGALPPLLRLLPGRRGPVGGRPARPARADQGRAAAARRARARSATRRGDRRVRRARGRVCR